METKICQYCGVEYTPSYSKQKYCSNKCASIVRANKCKANRIVKKCEVCGKEMYLKKSSSHIKYCSRECTYIGRNTQIEKVCEYCGKKYHVIESRDGSAKYCSRECADKALHGIKNCTCSQCGKKFHMKKSQKDRYDRNLGIFCSQECLNKYKKIAYSGSGNHQFGLKGPLNASFNGDITYKKNHKLIEREVYCPDHPFCNKNGRVWEHRLVVEQNFQLFDTKYFTVINGKHYLIPRISVHHKDGDHNNNDISNLMPCTISEHRKIHEEIKRSKKDLKTAVVKQGELLESPEVGNQQPSQPLTKLEGSETRY